MNARAGKPDLHGTPLDREIAEWALNEGALLELYLGEAYLQIAPPETLPVGDIRLQAIEFAEGHETVVTASDVIRMSDLPALTTLGLYDAEVAADAWPEFPRFQRLQQLSLGKTTIPDEALLYISQLGNVYHLRLGETNITDAGLEKLAHMVSLRQLDLQVTLVSEAGIARLHAALPHCRIYCPHGVIRPKTDPPSP